MSTSGLELRIDDLVVERGGRTVVAGLSLAAGAGEAIVLTGPNGAGKTSLLRTVAGYIRPAAGTVALHGADDDAPPGERAHFIGHLDGVKARLTVRENLAFWCACLGEADALDGVEAALAALDIAHLAGIEAGFLSAGQKRRLALARLVAVDRPLWLLDEPTVSLDGRSIEAFARTMQAHLGRGGIIVAATHVPLGLEAARRVELGTRGGGA